LQQVEITLDESNPERTLKWELNGKTGRQIGFTPFFSDGRYLYVLSYRHEPEFDGKSLSLTSKKIHTLMKFLKSSKDSEMRGIREPPRILTLHSRDLILKGTLLSLTK